MDRGDPGRRIVHALFYQRGAGDDALLRLAGRRFAEAGLAAEGYADTPDELERLLRFVPPHPRLPTVHLNRGLNMLCAADRETAGEFAARFAGRLTGMVVHDHPEPGTPGGTGGLVAALRELDRQLAGIPGAPWLFVEYAAGLEPGRFVEQAEQLAGAERISFCIDVGHAGIRQASARFGRAHPDIVLPALGPADERLPALAADVQEAMRQAAGDVLDMTRAIGQIGKHLHFHLHDGHPLVPGLADHFGFLARLPVPFSHDGRRSLPMLYGPAGLAAIVGTALGACGPERLSLTLEIHQVEGRLPLGEAAGLFRHWQDTTEAERMNYWLSVLAENAVLAEEAVLAGQAASPADPTRPGAPPARCTVG